MAETTVSLAIDNLAQLLIEEAESFRRVHKEIQAILYELQSIQSFLKDADAKAEQDTELRLWVKQVREVSYRIEDAIDSYMLHKARHRHGLGFFSGFAHRASGLKKRHELALEIQLIKDRVREIGDRCLRYNFKIVEEKQSSSSQGFYWQEPRPSSLFVDEADLVGIESPKHMLINWLVEGISRRVVISVVGMGGIGKTTLAMKVYESNIIKREFECYAWINVSQSSRIEELQRTILQQFYNENDESVPKNFESMEVRRFIQRTRYLVVFDDVWNTDFWRSIRHILPDNNNGSRIIITTRKADVASSCEESSPDHVLQLRPLSPEVAWVLFCKKAFRYEFGGHCPPQLDELSRSIAAKCEGLPLAIVAIGGLMSTREKSVSQWAITYRSLGAELQDNPFLTAIYRILSMSYDDLPYYLKSCFLYFGIFPEDYIIRCSRLIKLWIAEGFVKERRGLTLEEVAQDYLIELINRNLIQVTRVNFAGKAKSCRVQVLMREIIMIKSRELSFCQVFSEEGSSFRESARRLSIQCSTYDAANSIQNPMVRSVFLFNADNLPSRIMMSMFCSNFKLLKVLDFKDAPLESIPKEVGNLFHLRYLSVRGTKIKELPKSIGKLHNLETLDLKYTLVRELPIQINRLQKLRHLLACNSDYAIEFGGVNIQEGFGCLKALQMLYYVDVNYRIRVIEELGFLMQLKKLGIVKLTRENCRALCSSIDKMYHLQSLQAYSLSEDEIIDLQFISSPPPLLQHLCLKGRLTKLPHWIAVLHNLVSIHLISSMLIDDLLDSLQHLPNLLMLSLHEAYDGKELYFTSSGFQRLKVLRLTALRNLHLLTIDEEALPSLKELTIGPSPQLQEVPSGIQYLTNLTTLTFVDMPEEFAYSMQLDGGRDYWKAKHIPSVLFERKSRGTYQDTYDLHDQSRFEELYS